MADVVTRREELERHVEWLWVAIEAAAPSEQAPLLRERRLTLAELAALPQEGQGVTKADELAARRAKRHGDADRASAAPRSQPRRRGGGG